MKGFLACWKEKVNRKKKKNNNSLCTIYINEICVETNEELKFGWVSGHLIWQVSGVLETKAVNKELTIIYGGD